MNEPLPIDALLPDIRASLSRCTRLVLEAAPGAGKTTRVPLALLDAEWLAGRRILMLEPRRVAARNAAGYMASLLGQAPGDTVGYRIRHEACVGPSTRIEVLTEGILTRRLQGDPGLDGVGLLIFDEFHERNLNSDLGLVLALEVQAGLREDLRLLVMSATLDGEALARHLDAPRLRSEGRSYPVELRYPSLRARSELPQQVLEAVRVALDDSPGDVLVFLPGRAEIEHCQRLLMHAIDGVDVMPLHGELPVEQQASVINPPPDAPRRVVLATNVAESSLTLPRVRAVVDSGLAREPRFDPLSGLSRLLTVPITQSSATQRAGRAGRLGPGLCLRLWPQSQRLELATRAEITQVDLAPLALQLAAWGSDELPWLDAPPAAALAQARELLQRLGALDEQMRINNLGRRMLALGAHPREAALALAARSPAQQALAADLLALSESRDPLRGPARSDALGDRLIALQAFRQRRPVQGGDRAALSLIERNAARWRRRLGVAASQESVAATAVGDLLSHGWPERIARQLPEQPLRYQLANGRGARLGDDSALYGEPWLLVTELRADDGDALIRMAAPLDPQRLEREQPQRFQTRIVTEWDARARAVVAWEEQCFDALRLSRRRLPSVPEAQRVPALLAALRALGMAALPWSEALRSWQSRALCLREWAPELGLPDVSDEGLMARLEQWLPPWLDGVRKLDDLAGQRLADALRSQLDHHQRQQLELRAPQELAVPSGRHKRVEYKPGQAPVLAVKLQELFGLADTPCVNQGRVPVALHLLSPAQRPIQVTADLRGFWERTYPEVRKELKGRYPRHPWPEDPWTATPTARAKPRR